MAIALQMYASDYDNCCLCCPPGMFVPWWGNIQAYVKNRQVIRCPSDSAELRTDIKQWPSYGYNGSLSMRSLAAVDKGEAVIAFIDANATKIFDLSHLQPSDDQGTPPGPIVPRHNGGYSASFTDCHAKWLKRENLKPGMFRPDWTA